MITGKIKWYNGAKGFGFIQSDAIAGDIFVHYSALKDLEARAIDIPIDTSVAFTLTTGPKGPQAFDVEILKE